MSIYGRWPVYSDATMQVPFIKTYHPSGLITYALQLPEPIYQMTAAVVVVGYLSNG